MTVTHKLLLITAIFSTVLCQKLPPTAIASIMHEILTPKSPEQNIQLVQGVITKNNGVPDIITRRSITPEAGLPRALELPLPVRKSVTIEAGLPRDVLPNKIMMQKSPQAAMQRNIAVEKTVPTKVILQNSNKFVVPKNVYVRQGNKLPMPRKVIVKKSTEMQMPKTVIPQNEMVKPIKVIRKPEFAIPNEILVNNVEVIKPNRKILVQKAGEIPFLKNMVVKGNVPLKNKAILPKKVVVVKSSDTSQVRPATVVKTASEVVVKQPKLELISRDKNTVKTFLAAMSPISDIAASNPLQSRGQFLRKIPIPPPTI